MLAIGKKYNIGFPRGKTTMMELIEIESYKDQKDYEIKCTFLSSENVKVMFTNRVIKRLRIVEVMPQSLPNPCLGDSEPRGLACMPLPCETSRDWLTVLDDDLYS